MGSYTGLGLGFLGFSVGVVSYVSAYSLGGADAGMGVCFWFGHSGLGLQGRVVLVLMSEWLGWGWSFCFLRLAARGWGQFQRLGVVVVGYVSVHSLGGVNAFVRLWLGSCLVR